MKFFSGLKVKIFVSVYGAHANKYFFVDKWQISLQNSRSPTRKGLL